MRNILITTAVLTLLGLAGSAQAQTVVSADITTDTTWSGTVILEGPIFVDGATLTILPGTIVRGQPRTGPILPSDPTGSPGVLIVAQGGRIDAAGTQTSPIIMTTAAIDVNADGIPDSSAGFLTPWTAGVGLSAFLDQTPATAPLAPLDAAGVATVQLWGGLAILGNAPTNLDDSGFGGVEGQDTLEGLLVPGLPPALATYGGDDPWDTSGRLEFVSVRHAGDVLSAGNELNGITLGGVGLGTQISNIEVYMNMDDGVEWFGGTVSQKYVHVAMVGDDGLDTDQGFVGITQFAFVIGAWFDNTGGGPWGTSGASGDRGAEWDGDDCPACQLDGNALPTPLGAPSFYNITIVGGTPDGTNPATDPNSANRGITMRNGWGGDLANSIIVNTGTANGLEIEADAAGAFIDVMSTTFDDTAGIVDTGKVGALALGDTESARRGADTFFGANANCDDGTFPGLLNEDVYFDPRGNASGLLDATLNVPAGNPRVGSGFTCVGGTIKAFGFGIEDVSYRGAFDPSAAVDLWTTGWTALSIGGILVD